MSHHKFLLFLCLFPTFLCAQKAQNLVVNGSFERESPDQAGIWKAKPKPCTFSPTSGVINTCAQGWTTYNDQTPDLLVWDSLVNCGKFPVPHKGKRMLGLIMYHPFQDGMFSFDYHEVVQGSLHKKMEVGKQYKISFWAYTDDSIGVRHLLEVFGKSDAQLSKADAEARNNTKAKAIACNNFGFHFSESVINPREKFMEDAQINFPIKPQVNVGEVITTPDGWRKITLTFKPVHPYQYFVFGNLFSDAVTDINMSTEERENLDLNNNKLDFWRKTKRISYYCFDDFVIKEDKGDEVTEALLNEKKYTFEAALLFDTGKSALKEASKSAIVALGNALLQNKTIQLEIGGHTDQIGDDASNQSLSEQRAKVVYDALIAQGVPTTQITWKGYGETQPIDSNDTESGRQKNRRVECRVK